MADATFDSDIGDDVFDETVLDWLSSSDSGSEFDGFDIGDIANVQFLRNFPMEQPDNDREHPVDVNNAWQSVDSPPILAPFTSVCGLNEELADDPQPIDFFNYLFDENMWQILVEETNRYAQNTIDGADLRPHSRLQKWMPVSLDEMKVFFALIISMGLNRKPDISDYWCKDPTLHSPFYGNNMSKDRFLSILSNLHLVDNRQAQLGDRLYKIRPFLNMLNDNFSKYSPSCELSIDEATCPFKGRVLFRTYNPAKPNKWGMKIYQVCEAATGYCVSFDVYDGTEGCSVLAYLVNVPESCTKTTKIVIGLLVKAGALNKGHHIYLDNYYTSPELFDLLESNDTYACGTVRSNRQEVPKIFKATKLKQGESIFRRRGNLLAVKHRDKRDIHMLSTIHEAQVALLDRLDRAGEVREKPIMIVDYCKHMGGVDVSDQVLQYYDVLRRCSKWWKKLFLHLFSLLLVNAYKLYVKFGNPPKRRAHQKFRSSLAHAILESAPTAPRPSGGVGRHVEVNEDRFIGRHFPSYIQAKAGAKRARPLRDCGACNKPLERRQGFKRKQTSFMCNQCNIPLCVPVCFETYHTHKHYKRSLQGEADDSDSN